MEYPKNGSVIILDDKFEEVEDLIVELSKKNVPTYYFTGKHDKLHRELNNIKIIFLDLNYDHSGATNKQETIDNLVRIVTSLINENSKEYIIITWATTTESYHDDLQKRLEGACTLPDGIKKLYRMPKHIFSIDKSEVKTNGVFDIEKINKEINKIIPKDDIINLSIHWENNVLESAKNVLQNFEDIAPTEEEQKKIYALFADSITQSGSLTNSSIISPALAPISGLLTDQLSFINSSAELDDLGTELLNIITKEEKLELSSVAKINTFYHVDTQIFCNDAPGVVYDYKEYMDKKACSIQQCETKWSESLLEKASKDFTPSSMDKCIETLYNKERDKNKKLIMPYIEGKTYKEHVEIATKKELNLEDELNNHFTDFSSDDEEDKKKEYLKEYHEHTNKLFIEKLIVFVFKKQIDDEIKEELNKGGDFEKLSEKNKVALVKKHYIEIEKELIKEKHKIIPIFLEFSPDCDYVQKNRKKLRLIFGMMYPYSCYVKDDKNFKGDNYIYTPIIDYNGVPYKVVLDLHSITGINSEAFADIQPIFRFRKELLVDIQQKIASHIARPGFFNMNEYLAK